MTFYFLLMLHSVLQVTEILRELIKQSRKPSFKMDTKPRILKSNRFNPFSEH